VLHKEAVGQKGYSHTPHRKAIIMRLQLLLALLPLSNFVFEVRGAASSSHFIDEALHHRASEHTATTTDKASPSTDHFARRSGTRAHVLRDGQGFNNVDALFVVNLKHRDDRRKDIDAMFTSLGVTKHKFVTAVPTDCGYIGSSLSHAMAVAECVHLKYATCAVFEDDFSLQVDAQAANRALDEFFFSGPADWDVALLSGSFVRTEKSPYPFVEKVLQAFHTSGYLINGAYAPMLLENFMESAYMVNSNCTVGAGINPIVLDAHWQILQPQGNWFGFHPKIGKQQASFSDIAGSLMDWNL
jgi:hypothetical protein